MTATALSERSSRGPLSEASHWDEAKLSTRQPRRRQRLAGFLLRACNLSSPSPGAASGVGGKCMFSDLWRRGHICTS